jgi:hypothetical protein
VSKAGAKKPTGTIGIIGQETSRYSQFAICLANLRHPGFTIQQVFGYDAAYARHRLAETFTGDYLFFLDDDHAFQTDLLERLLAHKVDIVAPLYCKRGQQFAPTAYKDGNPITLDTPGLVEVDYTGTSGMLIHRRVLDKIGAPYFRAGALSPHMLLEDVDFCQRARAAGFRVWCDTSIQFGHTCAATLTPVHDSDRWRLAVAVGDTVITVPYGGE